jgi:hypothetical protein
VLAEYLDANDAFALDDHPDDKRAEALFKDVVARAPNFSEGHAMVAYAVINQARAAPAVDQPRLLEAARAEATRAYALDRADADAVDVLMRLRPISDWRGREALAAKAASLDATQPFPTIVESTILAQVGREREAAAMTQRAVAIDPFLASARALLSQRLAMIEQPAAASASLAAAVREQPGLPYAQLDRYAIAVWNGHAAEADALLDDPKIAAWAASLNARDVIRLSSHAQLTGRAADRRAAIFATRAALTRGRLSPDVAINVFAINGDLDDAFAAAASYLTPQRFAPPGATAMVDPSFLFTPLLKELRRDRRFMALAATAGLVEYWRNSGRWPDFCAEPDLAYDCKTEAARLASAR